VTDTDWQPLSRRVAGLPGDGPIEGVPDFLYERLREWLFRALQHTDGPVLALRPGHGYSADTQRVMLRLQTTMQPWLLGPDDHKFLDAIDATLRWREWLDGWDFESPQSLEAILYAANSAWRVASEFSGLERRVDATITAAVAETIRSAGDKAADHLRTAWEKTYGYAPEPDTAYREAVLAVEEAAGPLVLPASTRPTLGTVRDHLRDAGGKWELVLPDRNADPAVVDVIVSMLSTLEAGQRSRHAGGPNARRQTQAEAEAAFHLAAALVQWIVSGVLRRKGGS